jgi:hypothetical protein
MKRDYQIARTAKEGLEPVRKPTELDIAWAAGIYEGEGSCNTTVKHKTAFTVQITQKDPEFLYRLRDLFGGSVKGYDNGGFWIHHWRTSGNKARTFLGSIYPFLTVRRKAQIDATGARYFLNDAAHLISAQRTSVECPIYSSLWKWIEEKEVESRKQAKEYKTKRMNQHYADKSKDKVWMEKRRLATAKWRAEKKNKEQQSNVLEMKKIA